jgi:DNA (cytosine-5)-methyltransferase 1
MRIGSLFSGIGGLEWAGLGHVVFQCESDPFCREVLEAHWPGVPKFDDVRTLGKERQSRRGRSICGGPAGACQDVSGAGKGAGLSGARSGLWSEFSRIVGDPDPSGSSSRTSPPERSGGRRCGV